MTSINYRLGGVAIFPVAIQDVKTALRWLRAHAYEYGIDKDKFLVWGAAGGLLTALAGTCCGIAELEPNNLPNELAAISDCAQAVDFYDLLTANKKPTIRMLLQMAGYQSWSRHSRDRTSDPLI